jgi:hypothetical protein
MHDAVRSDPACDEREQIRDVAGSTIPVASETERAAHCKAMGDRVVLHRGRHWRQRVPGFYDPVHPLARLTAREAARPAALCWGYQAVLAPEDAHRANATARVYLLSDLGSFDEDVLPSSHRYKLRKARRQARLVQLTGPALLRDQGYAVLRSARSRTGHGSIPTRERYLRELEHFGASGSGIVLAGLVDGRLLGYLTGHAVQGTAYVDDVVIADEALNTQISTGLTYEFVHACRRSPNVTELMHGWHTPENEGLCRYKDWMDLPLQALPCRTWLLPGAAPAIRWRSPHKHYRLTGHEL